MNKTKVFCYECLDDVSFTTQREEQLGSIKGVKFPYMRMVARCVHCNEELDVYNDENLKILYDTYREIHGLISLEKIRKIPDMYGIGKRMLSLLLGWGEITFTRYYDGCLPTKQYSDTLEKLYNDPQHYRSVLEEGKQSINELTYRKSKLAIQKLLSAPPTPIMKVAGYLQKMKDELSSFRLQKLLYYTQGVSASFRDEPLFLDPCEAWVNGPVYREVYHKYREKSMDDVLGELLSDEEREVCDCVLACFGRYDGDTLVAFTHKEDPWLKARGDLPADVPSSEVITLDAIREYFVGVRDKYGMSSMGDMKVYAQEMFNSI